MKMMLGGFACVAMGVRAHAHAVARPRTHARTHARTRAHVQGRPPCIIDGLVLYDLASNQTALRGSFTISESSEMVISVEYKQLPWEIHMAI